MRDDGRQAGQETRFRGIVWTAVKHIKAGREGVWSRLRCRIGAVWGGLGDRRVLCGETDNGRGKDAMRGLTILADDEEIIATLRAERCRCGIFDRHGLPKPGESLRGRHVR